VFRSIIVKDRLEADFDCSDESDESLEEESSGEEDLQPDPQR
jgi:hypothetical protein